MEGKQIKIKEEKEIALKKNADIKRRVNRSRSREDVDNIANVLPDFSVENLKQENEIQSFHEETKQLLVNKNVSSRKRKRASEEKKRSIAYKKGRETANVRNRRYLDKMSDSQKEERNRKKREAYKKKKELNLVKSIKDLTLREQKKKRKYWREAATKSRTKREQDAVGLVMASPCKKAAFSSRKSDQFAETPISSKKNRGDKISAKNCFQILKEAEEKNKTIAQLKRKIKTLQKALQRKNSPSLIKTPSPKT